MGPVDMIVLIFYSSILLSCREFNLTMAIAWPWEYPKLGRANEWMVFIGWSGWNDRLGFKLDIEGERMLGRQESVTWGWNQWIGGLSGVKEKLDVKEFLQMVSLRCILSFNIHANVVSDENFFALLLLHVITDRTKWVMNWSLLKLVVSINCNLYFWNFP
jgi:hypothetical protein